MQDPFEQHCHQNILIRLHTGYDMPGVGFGTLGGHGHAPQSPDSPQTVAQAVEEALIAGYRHLDCAECYGNEAEIGGALCKAFKTGIKRDDIFVTSKVWNTNHSKKHVRNACQQTLKNLGLEYLDLYLIHWPLSFQHTGTAMGVPRDTNGIVGHGRVPLLETWQEMESLVDDGLVRSIGVSNFSAVELGDLLASCRIRPAVNQVECHPYLAQKNIRQACEAFGCKIVAYSPLGGPANQGCDDKRRVLSDPTLEKLASNRGCTVAQLVLRWLLQEGIAVIPKSSNKVRLEENLASAALDELSAQEMGLVRCLDCNVRYCNPDWAFGGSQVFEP